MKFTSLHALLNLHVHACFQTATQIVLFYTSHFGLGIEKLVKSKQAAVLYMGFNRSVPLHNAKLSPWEREIGLHGQ